MHPSTTLAALAVAASLFLVFHRRGTAAPLVALVVSGLELLRVLGVIHLGVRGVPIHLLLSALLTGAGAVALFQVQAKWAVVAATCVTLVGLWGLSGGLRAF